MTAYEAVIRYLAGRERFAWDRIYIQDLICTKAGDAVGQQNCGGAFTAAERDDLVSRLDDLGAPIEFVHSYADADPRNRILEGRERSVFVRVGHSLGAPLRTSSEMRESRWIDMRLVLEWLGVVEPDRSRREPLAVPSWAPYAVAMTTALVAGVVSLAIWALLRSVLA